MRKIDAYQTSDDEIFASKAEAEAHEIKIAAKNLGAMGEEGFINLTKGETCAAMREAFETIARALPPQVRPAQ